MENPLVIKALAGVLAWAALVYLLLLRPWRPRRLLTNLTPSVDLLFLSGLLVGVMALYQPAPFRQAAEALVAQTALPANLAALDERIDSIEQLPERLWAELAEQLGRPPAESERAPIADERGRLERTLMPGIVGLLEILLRGLGYAGSLLALAVGQVLRLVAGLRRAPADRPVRRSAALEARVAALEETLRTLHYPVRIDAPR